MELISVYGQLFISVQLHDLEPYMEQLPLGQQLVADVNIALHYGPINIAIMGASMSPQEAYSHMMMFWEASKKNGSPIVTPPAIDNTAQNG